jgi:hypothetical protein
MCEGEATAAGNAMLVQSDCFKMGYTLRWTPSTLMRECYKIRVESLNIHIDNNHYYRVHLVVVAVV